MWLNFLGVDPGLRHTGIGAVAYDTNSGRVVATGVQVRVIAKDAKARTQQRLKVAVDDMHRTTAHFDAIKQAIDTVQPAAIGVETYTIYDSKEYEKLRDVAAGLVAFLGFSRGGAKSSSFTSAAGFVDALHNGHWAEFMHHLAALSKAVDAFRVQRGRGDAAKTYGVYASALCAAHQAGVPVFPFAPTDLKRLTGERTASKTQVADHLATVVENASDVVETHITTKGYHEHAYDALGHAYLAFLEWKTWAASTGVRRG